MLNDTYNRFHSLLTTNNASFPFEFRLCSDRHRCVALKYHWTFIPLYMQYDNEFQGVWMKTFSSRVKIVITRFGWCSTFNMVDQHELLHANQSSEYFSFLDPGVNKLRSDPHKKLNRKSPLFSTQKELGFGGNVVTAINSLFVCRGFYKLCSRRVHQSRLIFHSSFELPDERHRNFVVENSKVYKFHVTPQLRVTDGTLMGLGADE
jgi:hypothetical protein